MSVYKDVNRAIKYLKSNADLTGFNRKMLLRIGDKEIYLRVENSDIKKTKKNEPDITIEMSDQMFDALAKKEISPLRAYALRKIKVKASMGDIMFLTKLFK